MRAFSWTVIFLLFAGCANRTVLPIATHTSSKGSASAIPGATDLAPAPMSAPVLAPMAAPPSAPAPVPVAGSLPTPAPVPDGLTVSTPSNGANASGTITITGYAGSPWINIAAFDANQGWNKVSNDAAPSNGMFSLQVDTTRMANGSGRIAVRAFSVPPGQSGGASAEVDLSLTVSNALSGPPAPQPGTTMLGACGSCDGGPQGITDVNNFESYVGKKEGYVNVWGWAQNTNNFEYAFQYLSNLWPASYNLLWTVPMIIDGTTFAAATAGTYDSSYLSVARTIAARDPHAIIRMGQEMNGDWETWSIGGPAGSAADFAAAYRHIVTLFRSVSPSFRFDWNPGLGAWAGIDPVPAYPGDAYVDYIALDAYEDGTWVKGTPDERWSQFLTMDGRGLDFWAQYSAQHGKPLAFDEWASNIDDGSYIQHMYYWMASHNVAYQMYWDSEAAFSGSFATHPNNGAMFRSLFGDGK